MTKRLQVLLQDDELAEIQRLAKGRRQTTAAFVRDALRAARTEAYPDPEPKLRAIREALTFDYPTGDIETINAEIERGYGEPGSGEPGSGEPRSGEPGSTGREA
ncbi:MAG TPA: CopG family transcriptional regulator [Candidatus Limnocylindrales bacterium]|nr:CopG family transcriptional regulator [Candidatus Limnocylindrales bacterium]